MADIFVSYAREDRPKIEPFVELLEQQGWSVWWDREIIPGHSFGHEIDKQIYSASCVLVFWSQHSIQSNWVQAEANEGLERGILIPILLEDVRVPLEFRRLETVPLIGWPSHEEQDELKRVLNAIRDNIASTNQDLVLVHRRPGRFKWVGLAIFGLVLATLAIFLFVQLESSEAPTKADYSKPSTAQQQPVATIAVMPFSSMGVDISAELIQLLETNQGFFVANPEHVKAALLTPDSVKLHVRYFVQGTINNEKLMVSLFDTKTKETLWNQSIDLQSYSLPQVTQSIASGIASAFNQSAISVEEVSPESYLLYLQAKSLLRNRTTLDRLQKVEALLLASIESAPRFSEAYAGLCETYTHMYLEAKSVRYFENAERHCFRAATLGEDNTQVDIALGKLYRVAGRYDVALERLESAIEARPFSTEVLRELAIVRQRQDQTNEAVTLLKTAQQIEPGYWRNYDLLAAIYFKTGHYREAATQYELTMDLVSDKTRLLNDLGSAYFLAEDFKKAVGAWQESLEKAATPHVLSNLGSAFYFDGDFLRAAESFIKAIELHPDDARFWANAGDAVMQTSQDEKEYFSTAVRLAMQQLTINPETPELLSLVAASHAALKRKKESLHYIELALSLGNNDIYVLYDVAVAFSRLGLIKRKQEVLQQLVALGYSQTLLDRDANFIIRRE